MLRIIQVTGEIFKGCLHGVISTAIYLSQLMRCMGQMSLVQLHHMNNNSESHVVIDFMNVLLSHVNL